MHITLRDFSVMPSVLLLDNLAAPALRACDYAVFVMAWSLAVRVHNDAWLTSLSLPILARKLRMTVSQVTCSLERCSAPSAEMFTKVQGAGGLLMYRLIHVRACHKKLSWPQTDRSDETASDRISSGAEKTCAVSHTHMSTRDNLFEKKGDHSGDLEKEGAEGSSSVLL